MAGITGGTWLGMIGFFTFMIYGGNNGCFAVVDEFYSGRGYESCGPFGATLGLLLGSVLSIVSFSKRKFKDPLRVAGLQLLGTLAIPFFVGMLFFLPLSDDGIFVIIPLFILAFMGASAIMSAIVVLIRSRLNK
jgi:predicted membrane protein